MIRGILSVLTLAVMILTGCSKEKKSYVSMKIDGKTYCSKVMTEDDMSVNSSNRDLNMDEDSFSFRYYGKMTSSFGSEIWLLLRFSSFEALQPGVRYELPDGSVYDDRYDTAYVRKKVDGQERYYYVVEGWASIDDVEYQYFDASGEKGYRVTGSFSFTAKDEFSGDVIEITDGELHRLIMF